MKSNFDTYIERRGTGCVKWDFAKNLFGTNDILPLWVADMDFSAPKDVVKKIQQAAHHGIYGYTGQNETYYDSFIAWENKHFSWKIEPSWCCFTPGIVAGLKLAIQTFTKPDEAVLVMPPVYYPFFDAIQTNNRRLVESPLVYKDNHYQIDFDDLQQKLTQSVKMLLLCSPHNPVGRVWTEKELERLVNLCKQNHVMIVSDEIHSDLVYSPNTHIPTQKIASDYANILTFMAPSKTFNIAGLSSSVAIIPNAELRAQFTAQRDCCGMTHGNLFGTIGFDAAYKYGEKWLQELLVYLKENFEFVQSFIAKRIPAFSVTQLEGTYLVWLDCRELHLSQKELIRFFVHDAKLGLNDGRSFGKEGMGFMRLNIGCPRSILKKAFLQLEAAVNKRFQ